MEIPLGEGVAPLRIQAIGGAGALEGDQLFISLRPEDITLHLEKPNGTSHGNVFAGNVIDTIYLGNFLECRIDVGGHEVGIQINHFEQLEFGQKVFLSFQPDHGLCLTE